MQLPTTTTLLLLLPILLQTVHGFAYPGSRSPSPVRHDLSPKTQPETAKHQQQHGLSQTTLHMDPNKAKQNRKEAQQGQHGHNGMVADEKPDASTNQGGKGAHIKMVPAREQQIEGGQMSALQQAAKRKGTNKVATTVKGQPAGKDTGSRGADTKYDLRQKPTRRGLIDILHQKRELIARQAEADAYADAYAEAYAALEAVRLQQRAAVERVVGLRPSFGYVY